MKNRKILSLLAFLLISFTIFANNDRGIEFYRAGMFEAAKNIFLQKTSQDPNEQAIAAYYLGLIYANEQNFTAAAAQFQRAIDIAPKSPYGYIGQGRLELKNNLKTAEKLFKQAEGLDKKNANVQVQIAYAFFANNMTAKAETALEKARKINRHFVDIYLLEGDIILKQNINSEVIGNAINKFQDAFYFSKEQSKLALLRLAQLDRMQGHIPAALNRLNQAIALDNDYLPAYIMLGDIMLSQGKTREAIVAYEKVIAAVEPPIEVFESYAQTLYFDKQFQESLELIQKVLAQKPDNAVLHRLEAYNLYELERYEEGVLKMEKFLASIPQDKQIYLDFITLGRFYAKLNNSEKAIESFNRAIVLDADKADIYKEMALALFSLRNYEEAIRNFDRYFELSQNVLPSELLAYGDISRRGAIETLGAFKNRTVTTPEEIAANRQLFDKYIEKGVRAYSDFIELVKEVSPNLLNIGYVGRAFLYSLVDEYERDEKTGRVSGIAKHYYEEALNFMLENNAEGRYNRDIIDSYHYLVAYYITNKDTKSAVDFLRKIFAIDPQNERAKGIVRDLKIRI